MKITPDARIRLLVSQGLSFVCATCKRWAEAEERGLERCTATAPCGSPIAGDSFHLYEGPITAFTQLCFVCGETPKVGIRVKGQMRILAVCEKHQEYMTAMAVKNAPQASEPKAFRIAKDGEALFQRLPRPKTLGNLLASIEDGTVKTDN